MEAPGTTPDDDTEALATQLRALANAKRLRALRFLVHPHHLEEIASELGVARQTAQEHVQQLLELGLVQTIRGKGDHGPVTDYVVVPQAIFRVQERFSKLGSLEPEFEEESPMRALTAPLATGSPAPREQDLPRLTIVHGMRIGRTTALTGDGPWLLGRDAHAQVTLDYDPYVSTRHAEVRRAAGGWELADLYSSNGTWVDWRRVDRGGSRRLDNGALLRVGKTLLLFRRP